MFNILFWWWLDSNCGPLESEATPLSTKPQPLLFPLHGIDPEVATMKVPLKITLGHSVMKVYEKVTIGLPDHSHLLESELVEL